MRTRFTVPGLFAAALLAATPAAAEEPSPEDRAASLSVYEWLTQQRHVDSDIRGDAWAAVTQPPRWTAERAETVAAALTVR